MPRNPLFLSRNLVSSRSARCFFSKKPPFLNRVPRCTITTAHSPSAPRRTPQQLRLQHALSSRPYLTDAIRNHQSRKMAPQLDGYFQQVDSLSDAFIERLRQAVAIPSVSSEAARRPDVVRMGQFLADELIKLGAEVELRPLGKQHGTDP
ncbi:hypothetical protein N0V88_002635 [Collariella sp. IMI 366227]|nr:hypothetical protein N0V88_002635 [Collariella sp. IMI 366227]